MIVTPVKTVREMMYRVISVSLCLSFLVVLISLYSDGIISMDMLVLFAWIPCCVLVISSDYKEMVEAFVIILQRIRKLKNGYSKNNKGNEGGCR